MLGMFLNFGPLEDFPDVGDVLTGDTTDEQEGTFENVSTKDVVSGYIWGEDGIEYTGTKSITGEESRLFFLRRT